MNPSTEEVFKLADNLHQQANALGEYIQKNKMSLSDDERNTLFNDQIDLLRTSARINTLGVTLVFADTAETLADLENITGKLQAAVKTVLKVEKALLLATVVVNLATAIMMKDPKVIVQKTKEALKAFGVKIKNPLSDE
jgi:hypothetical protein